MSDYLYYCGKCNSLVAVNYKELEVSCEKCGEKMSPLNIDEDEWNSMSNDEKISLLQRYRIPKPQPQRKHSLASPDFFDDDSNDEQPARESANRRQFTDQSSNKRINNNYNMKRSRKNKRGLLIAAITIGAVVLIGIVGIILFKTGIIGKSTASIGESESTDYSSLSEEARAVQRKIDKAMESELDYTELKEIQKMYNDLLNAEQETIKNYDKIEEQLTLSDVEACCVYTAEYIKPMLKFQSSFKIVKIETLREYSKADSAYKQKIYVKMNFTADNSMGGSIEHTYYSVFNAPTYNDVSKEWDCEFESFFRQTLRDEQEIASIQSAIGSSYESQLEWGQDWGQQTYQRALETKERLESGDDDGTLAIDHEEINPNKIMENMI